MQRREFIGLVGGAAAWPALSHAQSAMPVIGFLTTGSLEQSRDYMAAFHRGLAETGNIEGRNFLVEYRWADGQTAPLPALAAELVDRRVSVIVTRFTPPAVAAKAATQTIPIVFTIGADPVELGLVQSFAHPGGNVTGVASLNNALTEKRLEILRELLPSAKSVGFLFNPTSVYSREELAVTRVAARVVGVELLIVEASGINDFDRALNGLAKADAILVSGDALFLTYESEIISWANRVAIPAIYIYRVSVATGGLMSYGTNALDNAVWLGEYTGRILNGERPSNMPVRQNTHFYLIINLRTAKSIGLAVPPTLLARAHEVIE